MGFSGLVLFVLVIVVLLLWSRVGTLERKLGELERLVAVLKRGNAARASAPEAAPSQPVSAQPVRTVVPVSSSAADPPLQQGAIADSGPPRPVHRPEPPPARATEAAVRAPPAPDFFDAVVGAVKGYFTGGNLVVRVGIIVLFFGVGFLLKYAAEHTRLSIEARLAGVAAGAFILFALGWRLRHRRRGFSLALQGGALGILYLTLFAALQFYQLLPAEMTFLLMAVLGVGLSVLAVQQDSLALSMLGVTGGFLAPLLTSTGDGNHVLLFSYYALLNAFIVAQAWFKAWRPLNLLAFIFTFGVGTAWGVLEYEPSQFASTEPFLLFFFAAFIAIAVLFAFRTAPSLTHYVDGTLVFGTPLVAMALQMELVREMHHGRAWSASGAGILYLLLAYWLHHTRRDTLRLLKESFVALGVAFLTLAVPLWLDDTWTASTWALEGGAILWMGSRQGRKLPTFSGVVLQFASAVVYLTRDGDLPAIIPVANAQCMGALLIAAAGLSSAFVCMRRPAAFGRVSQLPSHLFLVWGLGWWLFAGGTQIDEFVPGGWQSGALLGLLVVTSLACGLCVRPLAWAALRVPALAILPLMMAGAAAWHLQALHPFSQGGWLAWPAAFAVLWWNLWKHERDLRPYAAATLHGFGLWLAGLLMSWELFWQISRTAEVVWADAAWGLPPALLLLALTGRLLQGVWPLRVHAMSFRCWVSFGFAALLLVWSVRLNWSSDGTAPPLSYVPFLNPVDVAVAVGLSAVARWLMLLREQGDRLLSHDGQHGLLAASLAAAFFWLNAVLLRTMHHWRGVPYQLESLMADTAVQASLSIFWTLLALGSMLWANRRGWRAVWFGGAVLMAVVVAKLFLVDLVRVGTVPRIVSFLVTGGLMLVIGYFSPLPPKGKAENS